MTSFDARTAQDLRDTAIALAEAARSAILPYFRSAGLSAENKASGGFDPVTEADRAAEQAMRDILARRRPRDGILGEEFGATEGESGLTWVLDPIDGTRAFLSGTPTWGVLIALSDARGPVLGVIDQPYTGERFVGGLGVAEWTGPMGCRALGARRTATLDQAILFTTFPEVGTPADRAAFERVSGQAMLTRFGMDCYAYALLAAGQIDLVIKLCYVTFLGIIGSLMFVESLRALSRRRRAAAARGKLHKHTWIHGLPFKLFRQSW